MSNQPCVRKPWNYESLFHSGESFYNEVFKCFSQAKSSIHIEAHYFDNGLLGRKFSLQIINALERGIEVYLILDGLSPLCQKNSTLKNLLLIKGAHIREFNPLPWRTFSWRALATLNQRNHKKMLLIDKKVAFVGSYNIDTRQMSYGVGSENWHDCGVRVEGPGVQNLYKGFKDTWHFCHFPHRKINPLRIASPQVDSGVRLNHHKSWRSLFFNDIIKRIDDAKFRVWITNPYFVPDKKMLLALRNAQMRGVEVIILIPQKSDLKLFPLINFIFIKSLITSGVQVYEYRPRILHAKTVLIDSWTMIGSSNLNSRSQKHDWEIDIILSSPKSLSELEDRFNNDLLSSTLVKSSNIFKRFGFKSFVSPFLIGSKYFL